MSLEICKDSLLAITDTMDVIGSKWRLPIIFSLSFGDMRYSELQLAIPKITSRMLSRELKELEINKIIERKVVNKLPLQVAYGLTEHGESLKAIFDPLKEWGKLHRLAVTQ